jgi:hypothetical protein
LCLEWWGHFLVQDGWFPSSFPLERTDHINGFLCHNRRPTVPGVNYHNMLNPFLSVIPILCCCLGVLHHPRAHNVVVLPKPETLSTSCHHRAHNIIIPHEPTTSSTMRRPRACNAVDPTSSLSMQVCIISFLNLQLH